jgi:hypothetical protein
MWPGGHAPKKVVVQTIFKVSKQAGFGMSADLSFLKPDTRLTS